MASFNRISRIAGIAALVASFGVSALEARTKKGDRLLVLSRAAELRKEWDKSLSLAEEALSEDPADIGYQLTTTRLRFYTSQYHVDQGRKMRDAGQLDQALAELQKAYGINPASSLAEEEIQRTKTMIEREAGKPAAEQKPEERGLTPTQVEKRQQEKKVDSMRGLPELRPLNPIPINLKMNNQPPKVLFETVGKLAGVNVLFDPEFSTGGGNPVKPQSLELNNATLEDALDYVSLITRSFWKAVSGNAIFVTQDNQTKRREFEDFVVKIFYLNNVLTAQEMQEIVTALRTVAEIQKIMTYQAQNAIVVRAEADKVALAEKIIGDLDKPRAEVLVDILVMQISRTKERDLSAGLANGINQPIAFTPRASISSTAAPAASGGAAAASTSIPLSHLGKVNAGDFSLTLPSGVLEALISDSHSKVLQSPQVRAVDGQKVSLKIGDRIPYASGSFQPGIGGVGINPLVNTQFTFLDTGVNIDIVPKIHGADEVSMHVDIDISDVKQFLDLGGVKEPEVSQTKVSNDVRLRQGEVNLIGGLMKVDESRSMSGVPWLSNIPLFGRLFSTETVKKDDTELVIVLIPHIIRAPNISSANLKGISAGNSTTVKLNYSPQKPEAAPSAPAPQPGLATPPTPQSVSPVRAAVPQAPAGVPTLAPGTPPRTDPAMPLIPGVNAPPLSPPATAPPPSAPPATAPPVPPASRETQNASPPSAKPKVTFVPEKASAQINGTVTASLMVESATDLASTPMQIRFDPKMLRLQDVVRGHLLTSDGQQVAFSKNVLNDTGEATINISRFPATGGVTGSGSIVTLVFQAVSTGETVVTVPQLTLRNSQSQPILTATPQLAVKVK